MKREVTATKIRQKMLDRFDALRRQIAKAYANVPPQKGLAEINALVAKVRTERPDAIS